jgi:hypothetical protein
MKTARLKCSPNRLAKLAKQARLEHQKALALLEAFKRTGKGGKQFARQNTKALNIRAELVEARVRQFRNLPE